MHLYLVERVFPPGSPSIAATPDGGAAPAFIVVHEDCGVVWLRSYLTPDHRRSYCIVDGRSAEAVRDAARASGLPVDRISEVRLLERGIDPAPAAVPSHHIPQERP